MNPQHTAGPWRVQPDPEWSGKHPYHDNRYITYGTQDLSDPQWGSEPGNGIICVMRDTAHQKSDAALIAAAPTLFRACEIAANNIRDGYTLEACAVLGVLESAIAKAKGEL